MPKRKRLLESEEGGSLLQEGRPKRRRNDTTLVDTIQYVFDALRNRKKDDDTYLCEAFLRVPKKRTEPQYYDVVKKPIDMLKIQQKIKTDIYNEIEEFCSDVQLLVENAKLYFAKSTEEYNDACELWKIFEVANAEAPEEVNKEKEEEEVKTSRRRGRPPKASLALSAPMIMEEDGTPMTVEDTIEELFGAIVTAQDTEGRFYSYDFFLLPAPEKYPDYYQVIQQPIDMKTIAQHIQDKHYENLDGLERDMNLMFDNACTFNEPGSRIYKDARTLKNLVHIRKQDLLHVLNAKKSVRLRSKRPPGDKKWSELIAYLQEGEVLPLPDEEQIDLSVSMTTHDDDYSDEDIDQDNPQWQLFNAVKSLAAPNDPNYLLVEPFRRLPNRRWHSDYYQEIKNPISLSQIKKKIFKGDYQFLSEMVEDFNLMLDNAQQYNRPDSRIFRDAVKLQKFMQTKAEELMSLEEEMQESDSDTDDPESQLETKKRAMQSRPWTFKRRAKLLFKTLMDYMTDDGRQPIVAFIEKPSQKDYPDYYLIVKEPMDMEMIETKIKSDQYNSDDELISDFRLMLSNCQLYNEAGSHIYKDAEILSKVLNDKLKEIQFGGESQALRPKAAKKNKYNQFLTMTKNIKLLYNAIRDYRDKDLRQLSEVFLKLPSKILYPDYYEVIKQPIDLERILHKWKDGAYATLDDILSDLTLMFQNACRYNEPESQIYRDALTLQRLALQKRLELTNREDTVPNIGCLVQELLMSLFISVFNLEDEDGRYVAESFADLSDYEEVDGQKTRVISFDIIKRRLDKGLYARLDQFQKDLFSVLERGRKSKCNSRIYEDSVTLQKEYMKVRDELCSYGKVLLSQALNFKDDDLLKQLCNNGNGVSKSSSQYDDNADDTNDGIGEDEDSKTSLQSSDGINNSFASHNEVQYYVGDFVFLNPPEKNCDYPILHIQRLWTNNAGLQMMYGCQYFRPAETFHLPNRKFYEQEVFKTEKHMGVPLSEVVGKCIVLSAIDYPKLRVENFDEKNVFVCESRYSSKSRVFKKIKVWPFNLPEGFKITERVDPLELKRVGSIFKERIDKHKEELAELDEETKINRPSLPNIINPQENNTKTSTFYQMYNIASGLIKLGDFIYARGNIMKSIRHISRIWVSAEGNAFFTGTKYDRAQDVTVVGSRQPYKKEVYLTALQDTLPLSDIIGRCCVLQIKDYMSQRPTEINENDIYLCENFYDEINERVCPLQSGIAKFNLPLEVPTDEIYFFWKPLNPQKFENSLPATKKPKAEIITLESASVGLSIVKKLKMEAEAENEDSLDGPPPSVASADSNTAISTPKPVKKPSATGKVTGRKQMTGYILFSAEIRKSVTARNPEANFGEISRLVGIEWKRLTESERKAFEDRAHQSNLECAERAQLNPSESPVCTTTPTMSKAVVDLPLPTSPDIVYECLWETCDYMFEDLADLYDHLLLEPAGHLHKVKTGVFECSWRGCARHKKSSLAPFLILTRLIRHMREVHIVKNVGRVIPHHERSRNFVPSSRRSLLTETTTLTNIVSSTTANNGAGSNAGKENKYQITFGAPIQVNGNLSSTANNSVSQKSYDPLFVNPPTKTQRLLHSEAYIKYIENLDKPFVGNWERQLNAAVENTIINETGRLPAHWLANGAGNHGSVVNALWALREYMMKDSLGISKIL